MAAAAAAARKPAHSQSADPLPKHITKGGYTAVPNVVITRLRRCLTYTEFGITLDIIFATVNAAGRPEWARVTEQQFADNQGVSVTEVRDSLNSLELRKKIIESKKAGRRWEYRILWDRLDLVEERKPRTLEKISEPRAVGPKEQFTLAPGQPARASFEEPTPEIELLCAKGAPQFSIERSMAGSVPRFVIGLQQEGATGVAVSGPRLVHHEKKTETATGVAVSPPKEPALRELLTPFFLRLYGRKPDDPLLQQIQRELKTATVEHYGHVVAKRLQQGDSDRIKSGLFVTLARETAEASAEIARRQQPKAPPVAKPSTFIAEPEHSTSPWAKIRRELSQHVHPQEYSNWLVRTRHGKLDDRRNELTVLVVDQVTADFLQQEYEELILRFAKQVGLHISSVRYRVAEDNS